MYKTTMVLKQLNIVVSPPANFMRPFISIQRAIKHTKFIIKL